MSKVKMSLPKSSFEGKLSTYVFGKCFFFWHFSELKSDCLTTLIYITWKFLNNFGCVELSILIEMWHINEAHIFLRSLVQTFWLETTPLCLITRLNGGVDTSNMPIRNNDKHIQINVWKFVMYIIFIWVLWI